ncbi:MAG: glycosyltransferase family 39 protein [Eubacteriales bacterium]|nr:glycosyltransferase family 39 protein [Eubacteriales bacterium]
MLEKKTRTDSAAGIPSEFPYFILLIAAAFIVSMQSPLHPWTQGYSGTDSSVFRYIALVMEKGGMPYADTFDHKGPLLYVINYLGSRISYRHGIWLIEFLFIWLTLLLMYKTAKLRCSSAVSCALTLCSFYLIAAYFEGGNYTEEYAMPFLAAAAYIFLDYLIHTRISRLRLMACGFCFGAVFMLRANMIALWIVFCLAVLIQSIVRDKRVPWDYLLYFLAGALLLVLPLALWLISQNAWQDFINDYILFNLKYSSWEKRATLYNRCLSVLKWLAGSVCFLSFLCLLRLIQKKKDVFLNVTYFLYEALSICLLALSGRRYGHYGMALLPVFIYPISSFASYIKEEKISRTAALLFAAALLVPAVPLWTGLSVNALQSFGGLDQTKGTEDQMEEVTAAVIENTSENDPIQVIGNYDIVYVESRRLAASAYSYQLPVSQVDDRIRKEFITDLETQMPKIVVVQENGKKKTERLFPTKDRYELLLETDEKTAVYRFKE